MRKKSILWTVLMMVAVSLMTSCTDAPQKSTSYVVEGILPDSTHHGEQIYLQRQRIQTQSQRDGIFRFFL